MIAATGSGSGKTMITCALLSALKKRGMEPVSFKCGPDYIDPLFHKTVLGVDSRNLDTFFSGEDGVRDILSGYSDRYAVLEGVMGIYDGMGPSGTKGSCYEVALITGTPIVLVVDASGVGRTLISLIKGIINDDVHCLIKGVILNKISESFYDRLKPVFEKEIREIREDVRLLGAFPSDPGISVESRYLGLKLPGETEDIRNRILRAADILEKKGIPDRILRIMEGSETFEYGPSGTPDTFESYPDLTLAVAYDDAFCFYYRDNLEAFEKRGVHIRYFSPLKDKCLPDDANGFLIGGGYPENYLPELSRNTSMLDSLREAVTRGIPSLAECGGFMYLHKTIRSRDGEPFQMAGVIDGECFYCGHPVRFGYLEIRDQGDIEDPDDILKSMVGIRGHEFHYYDSTYEDLVLTASKPFNGRKWCTVVHGNNGIWGFPHLYYGSRPEFIDSFISLMRDSALKRKEN